MPAILSISSRVVRGTVGNSLASFVLQRMGHVVREVPTVLWDRHPGLGRPSGLALTGVQVSALLADQRAAEQATRIDAVETGYFASLDQIAAVRDHVVAMRDMGIAFRFYCDPVCGDAPGAYVPEEVLGGLRDHLVPIADVLTPNRFELGLLTGLPVATNAEIAAAARELAAPLCLVTSAFGPEPSSIGNLLVTPGQAWLCSAARRDRVPNGTGDLMTALFAGWLANGTAPVEAMARAVAGIEAVLEMTSPAADELALVATQHAFVSKRQAKVVEVVP